MKQSLLTLLLAIGMAATASATLITWDGTGDTYYVGDGQYLLPSPLGSEASEATWVSGILGKTVMHDASVLAKVDGVNALTKEYSWDLTGDPYELCAVLLKDGRATIGNLTGQLYRLFVPGDEIQKTVGTQTIGFTVEKDISHLTPFICERSVPDGGATLALLGLGIVALSGLSRRLSRK